MGTIKGVSVFLRRPPPKIKTEGPREYWDQVEAKVTERDRETPVKDLTYAFRCKIGKDVRLYCPKCNPEQKLGGRGRLAIIRQREAKGRGRDGKLVIGLKQGGRTDLFRCPIHGYIFKLLRVEDYPDIYDYERNGW